LFIGHHCCFLHFVAVAVIAIIIVAVIIVVVFVVVVSIVIIVVFFDAVVVVVIVVDAGHCHCCHHGCHCCCLPSLLSLPSPLLLPPLPFPSSSPASFDFVTIALVVTIANRLPATLVIIAIALLPSTSLMPATLIAVAFALVTLALSLFVALQPFLPSPLPTLSPLPLLGRQLVAAVGGTRTAPQGEPSSSSSGCIASEC
jgi:hypothetical protein